jgi:hypothetical protein
MSAARPQEVPRYVTAELLPTATQNDEELHDTPLRTVLGAMATGRDQLADAFAAAAIDMTLPRTKVDALRIQAFRTPSLNGKLVITARFAP